jgi:hypothetical protein
MAVNFAHLSVKIGYMRALAKNMQQHSSSRDLGIQVEKLGRMLKEFNKKFPPESTSSAKAKGQHLHRLNQQSRRVDEAASEVWKEFTLTLIPYKPTPKQMKALPGATRDLIRFIDRKLYGIANPPALRAPSVKGQLAEKN